MRIVTLLAALLIVFCIKTATSLSFGHLKFRGQSAIADAKLINQQSTIRLRSSQSSGQESTSELRLSIWETIALKFHSKDFSNSIERTQTFTNTVSLLRVGVPSFAFAASAKIAYPYIAIELANAINDSGVFAVVSQDASQYIQNVLTTSGLTFSLLVGQTYYFMYQVSAKYFNNVCVIYRIVPYLVELSN